MKLIKLTIWILVLFTLWQIGANWAGFWHNFTYGEQEYNHYACQAVGKEDDCITPLKK